MSHFESVSQTICCFRTIRLHYFALQTWTIFRNRIGITLLCGRVLLREVCVCVCVCSGCGWCNTKVGRKRPKKLHLVQKHFFFVLLTTYIYVAIGHIAEWIKRKISRKNCWRPTQRYHLHLAVRRIQPNIESDNDDARRCERQQVTRIDQTRLDRQPISRFVLWI